MKEVIIEKEFKCPCCGAPLRVIKTCKQNTIISTDNSGKRTMVIYGASKLDCIEARCTNEECSFECDNNKSDYWVEEVDEHFLLCHYDK